MIFMFSYMILIMSMMIVLMNHPLSMGTMLLIQVLTISMITGSLSMNYWFSYILFLIMVGGMLVLFIYMTSIASNEKFKFSNWNLMLTLIFIAMSSLTIFLDQYFMEYLNFQTETINNLNFSSMISKFMNFPHNIILFVIITYLFITLIAVVKISKIKYGPLRQMN
uniref:NADH-ubiquinone oxidoreductase chain 6 n=1 Tax=Amphiops globus TaxID=1205654 RepID=A0A0S2MMZ1_9COLE|nr:NADH deshydrogenase subunit 6 [Amphiops globus]